MKTLSVKQPWSFLLCIGMKPIENRTWKLPEKYKGERVLIHSSAKPAGKITDLLNEKQQAALWWHLLCNRKYDRREEDLDCGAIIGSVRFTDCVVNHDSIWAEKTPIAKMYEERSKKIYNWVAKDAVLFKRPILGVKGKLGFWDYGHPYYCPHCAYPLHLQYLGDGVTDAFCFQCGKDIDIQKMVK